MPKVLVMTGAALTVAAALIGCSEGGSSAAAPVDETPAGLAGVEHAIADTGLVAAVTEAFAMAAGADGSAALAHLAELKASGRGIGDLSGIEVLVGLTALDVSDNAIEDVTQLAQLSELELLDLGGNQVTDLTPLAGLEHLTVLLPEGNAVSDLSPVLGLPALECLEVSGNPLSTWSRQQDVGVAPSQVADF